MPTFPRNERLHGLEISFEGVPDPAIRTELKNACFRWHRAKRDDSFPSKDPDLDETYDYFIKMEMDVL